VTGAVQDDGGVPHGRLLVEFAEAVLGEDEEALARARAALRAAIGPAGLADAAGVVGLFNAIDRVADATGVRSRRRKRQRVPTSAPRSVSTVSTSAPAAEVPRLKHNSP